MVNFEYQLSQEASFATALILDMHNGIFSVAYASVDIMTGKSHLFETHGTREDKYFALDEIFNLMQQYPAKEVVLCYKDKAISHNEIVKYLELHKKNSTYTIRQQRLKIEYQNELFAMVYQINSLLSPIEFMHLERYPMMSEVLAMILDFIIEHDYSIVQKLKLPTLLDSTSQMLLGNNPLLQLDIFSDSDQKDVWSLICKTSTIIGKRWLRDRLNHPILDKKELQRRYDLSLKLEGNYQDIEESLKTIYDLERILRRIRIENCTLMR